MNFLDNSENGNFQVLFPHSFFNYINKVDGHRVLPGRARVMLDNVPDFLILSSYGMPGQQLTYLLFFFC